MGYMHINNLYKSQEILAFKRCYAMEKIHGTSAHISFRDGKLSLSSGGEKHERFASLFDLGSLTAKFLEKFGTTGIAIIYGEAYGGKQQGMSATYGKELKFIAFEVKIGEFFLTVPNAAGFVGGMGLEFVDWVEVSTDIDSLNAERDKPSTQSVRNGIEEPKLREGIVLRPPFEVTLNNGNRIIAKHKRAEFSERGTPKLEDLDPTRRQLIENAEAIATEWVTPMRLEHVLDHLIASRENKDIEMRDTPEVIRLMLEDISREGSGEVVDPLQNAAVRKSVSGMTVKLFKQKVQTV